MASRPHVSDAQRRARLARRHRLADRADSVPGIADAVVALHSTDPASVYLSVVARLENPAIEPTADALHVDRSIVRLHGMRRTIWVCTPEVARVIHAACTVSIARNEWQQFAKYVAASGIDDAEAWVQRARADTLAALHRIGPTSARALGKAVPALTTKITVGSGKFVAQQAAHTRVLSGLGFDAAIVRTAPSGGWTSSEYEWCVMADWLADGIAGADPTASRDELVARYLRAFGPASATDLHWWTGTTAGSVKAAIAAIGAIEVDLDDGSVGWLLADDLDDIDEPDSWVALLPALDPTAMGWKTREWYLGEFTTFGGPLFDRNGNVGPTVWADGRVVGGWAQRADGSIAVEYLMPVAATTKKGIAREVERLHAVIGTTKITPRFPTPLQRTLAQG